MAAAINFEHSTSTSYYDSSNPYGENLAYAGTTGTVPGESEAYNTSTVAWLVKTKEANNKLEIIDIILSGFISFYFRRFYGKHHISNL